VSAGRARRGARAASARGRAGAGRRRGARSSTGEERGVAADPLGDVRRCRDVAGGAVAPHLVAVKGDRAACARRDPLRRGSCPPRESRDGVAGDVSAERRAARGAPGRWLKGPGRRGAGSGIPPLRTSRAVGRGALRAGTGRGSGVARTRTPSRSAGLRPLQGASERPPGGLDVLAEPDAVGRVHEHGPGPLRRAMLAASARSTPEPVAGRRRLGVLARRGARAPPFRSEARHGQGGGPGRQRDRSAPAAPRCARRRALASARRRRCRPMPGAWRAARSAASMAMVPSRTWGRGRGPSRSTRARGAARRRGSPGQRRARPTRARQPRLKSVAGLHGPAVATGSRPAAPRGELRRQRSRRDQRRAQRRRGATRRRSPALASAPPGTARAPRARGDAARVRQHLRLQPRRAGRRRSRSAPLDRRPPGHGAGGAGSRGSGEPLQQRCGSRKARSRWPSGDDAPGHRAPGGSRSA